MSHHYVTDSIVDVPCDIERELDLGMMCQTLYVMFHQSPTPAQLGMLNDNADLFVNYFTLYPDGQALNALAQIQAIFPLTEPTLIGALCDDYQQLFIGPHSPTAPPWGSVYLNPYKEMFDATTVEVENYYRHHGLMLDTGMHEPADHMGLMLAFVAWLFTKIVDARDNQTPSVMWLQTMKVFMSDYLLTWSRHFLALMQQNARTPFYANVAILADAVLKEVATYCNAQRKNVTVYIT